MRHLRSEFESSWPNRVAGIRIKQMRYRVVHSPAQEAALCLQDIVGYQANWWNPNGPLRFAI
jgi:hypothetical protein